ncbi:MAG: hypothetical protein JO224_01925 [Pelomonas sp.]|nr:hypothetical protein [Roseateles sp.]
MPAGADPTPGPWGGPAPRATARASREAGFTYLIVLFFVAISAAALAAAGEAWQNAAERERERELEFRGAAIARAIDAYRAATPGLEQYPQTLDELLEDRRGQVERHHLRQRYVDPFTGEADWVLEPDPSDPRRFSGVHSRSDHKLLRELTPLMRAVKVASDWRFTAGDYAGDAPVAASAPARTPGGRSASAPTPAFSDSN